MTSANPAPSNLSTDFWIYIYHLKNWISIFKKKVNRIEKTFILFPRIRIHIFITTKKNMINA